MATKRRTKNRMVRVIELRKRSPPAALVPLDEEPRPGATLAELPRQLPLTWLHGFALVERSPSGKQAPTFWYEAPHGADRAWWIWNATTGKAAGNSPSLRAAVERTIGSTMDIPGTHWLLVDQVQAELDAKWNEHVEGEAAWQAKAAEKKAAQAAQAAEAARVDLGNNETATSGVSADADGTFTALTFTESKSGFKTRKGAENWYARKTGKATAPQRGLRPPIAIPEVERLTPAEIKRETDRIGREYNREYAKRKPPTKRELLAAKRAREGIPPTKPKRRGSSADTDADGWPKREGVGSGAAQPETEPQQRRRLRGEARERQRETVPKIKTAIRELKAAKMRRRRECVASCKRRRQKITSEAKRAREKLSERVAKLRVRARETCAACKVSVRDSDLDELDRLLGHLAEERKVIGVLRAQARGLTSERGRAGGKRAAELRSEALDQVRRDVADDPILSALWEREQFKIKKRPRASLTETFLEWVQEHPEAIEAMQADQERDYAAEAEAMLGSLRAPRKIRGDADQARWSRELDEADQWLAEVKDAPEAQALPF